MFYVFSMSVPYVPRIAGIQIPPGFLLFPGELPGTSGFGISMVLLSAAMAQIVFALQSDLPVGQVKVRQLGTCLSVVHYMHVYIL